MLAGPQSKPIASSCRPEHRQVGDAAEVEDRDRRAGAAEDRAMKRRHERCALAAGGDVAAAEVGDDVDARQLGQQRRRIELDRVADAVELARAVANRLAMTADGDDRLRSPTAALLRSVSTSAA